MWNYPLHFFWVVGTELIVKLWNKLLAVLPQYLNKKYQIGQDKNQTGKLWEMFLSVFNKIKLAEQWQTYSFNKTI